MADGGGPFTATTGGVRVRLRVTPKASRNGLAGVADTVDGGRALKVAVTVVPEDGKANQAVIALLAKTLKAPKGAFTLVAGATDRNKIIDIAGDPADLLARLRAAAGMEDGA
jgi:uncharacterized protein (TIGR00251 family)